MHTKKKRDRRIPVKLTRRQWELVLDQLVERPVNMGHWKTDEAMRIAEAEVAQALGHYI